MGLPDELFIYRLIILILVVSFAVALILILKGKKDQKASFTEQTDELIRKMKSQKNLSGNIVSIVAELIEHRDKDTGGHIDRTTSYVSVLVLAMKDSGVYADELNKWNLKTAIASSRLHDVGKIGVSDLILNKPDKLTSEEFEKMKSHASQGVQIIEQIIDKTGDEEFLASAKLFAESHHERWDGAGYPKGLKGEEIPLQSRIMAVVDVYDALTSKRPYKPAFPHEKAVEIIMEGKGKQFDPAIVDVFFTMHGQFDDLREIFSYTHL
ncbi:MAG: HD domain-containing protein [Chitinivibrionia bacterium]|jgi:putative two-component system response regulator|nr:HD domain-containing protein [Chitinivibrionia bacterium]